MHSLYACAQAVKWRRLFCIEAQDPAFASQAIPSAARHVRVSSIPLPLQVQACKRNMNTFAFVGNLNDHPEVSCVYHSEEAENQFLRDPKMARMGDGYQPTPEERGEP